MVPESTIVEILDKEIPDLTYNINFENGKISGLISGVEAVTQAVYKILSTERYAHLIYDWYYGVEMEKLIGKSREYILASIDSTISDALLADDRVKGVNGFTIGEVEKDELPISFIVNTIYGDITITMEVII
jgi:hypothetical protein